MAANAGGFEHGTWEDLFYHIDKGDYATAYQQGETIPLDLGSTYGTIDMEISNFDYDVLASDTTQRAPVSLVAVQLLNETHRWNPNLAETEPPYTEGTGAIGGWPKSELRAWMIANVLPAIPANVTARIATVAKYSCGPLNDGAINKQITSEDKVFVPSAREIDRRTGWETGRALTYNAIDSDAKRSKHMAGASTNSKWWTRSNAYNSKSQILCVAETGANAAAAGNVASQATNVAICLCFCLS